MFSRVLQRPQPRAGRGRHRAGRRRQHQPGAVLVDLRALAVAGVSGEDDAAVVVDPGQQAQRFRVGGVAPDELLRDGQRLGLTGFGASAPGGGASPGQEALRPKRGGACVVTLYQKQ